MCPAGVGVSEEIRVRSGADEVQIVAVDFVDRQPVRLDVAIAVVAPFAAERVTFVPGWQRLP